MRLLLLLSFLSILVFSNCGAEDAIDALFIDISGSVSDDGQPVEGALMLLVDSPNLSDGVSLSNASLSNANGDYAIVGVEAGDYYVVAVDDVNDNLEFDLGTDRFGFYGADPGQLDLVPNLVTITTLDVEDIDITYLIN